LPAWKKYFAFTIAKAFLASAAARKSVAWSKAGDRLTFARVVSAVNYDHRESSVNQKARTREEARV
jgi:hypothetical protein